MLRQAVISGLAMVEGNGLGSDPFPSAVEYFSVIGGEGGGGGGGGDGGDGGAGSGGGAVVNEAGGDISDGMSAKSKLSSACSPSVVVTYDQLLSKSVLLVCRSKGDESYHREHRVGTVGAGVDRGLGSGTGTHNHNFRNCAATSTSAGGFEVQPSKRGGCVRQEIGFARILRSSIVAMRGTGCTRCLRLWL